MVKKKKKYMESPTQDFRNMSQVAMGAGMVGTMTPLIGNPSAGNIGNAMQGSMNMAILAPMAGIGFNAIDNITKTGKKKKY